MVVRSNSSDVSSEPSLTGIVGMSSEGDESDVAGGVFVQPTRNKPKSGSNISFFFIISSFYLLQLDYNTYQKKSNNENEKAFYFIKWQ
jgi:hypothetical protein